MVAAVFLWDEGVELVLLSKVIKNNPVLAEEFLEDIDDRVGLANTGVSSNKKESLGVRRHAPTHPSLWLVQQTAIDMIPHIPGIWAEKAPVHMFFFSTDLSEFVFVSLIINEPMIQLQNLEVGSFVNTRPIRGLQVCGKAVILESITQIS